MNGRKGSATREDLQHFKEEILHQFHVIFGGVVDQVKQVAEGVATLNEGVDRTRKELKEEIHNKTQPIAQAVLEISGKVAALDGKVVALDAKVVALDGKVDRIHQELKREIQETRQEVLAAVKFSYAELDKRLTTLEKEFIELKHRVEKIESHSVS